MKTGCIVAALCLIALLFSTVALSENTPSVVAYYFHTTLRCPSCQKIQQFTEEALKKGFPQELASGKLVYEFVNVEDPGNEHFIKDYGLYTKSVVLSVRDNGKEVGFKNLDKVWQLLNNKEKFISYIEDEVKESLS